MPTRAQFYDAVMKGEVKQAQQMVSGGLSPSDILASAQDKQSPLQVHIGLQLCASMMSSWTRKKA